MSRSYTTDSLIESIKRRASVPVNQSTFTPTRLLAIADDVILERVVPMIRTHREEHFRTYLDTTTTTETTYAIPPEAMNRGLVNVSMLDANGREYALLPTNLDREIEGLTPGFSPQVSTPARYFPFGDKLRLYPTSTAGLTLRQYYERLPNRLCLSQTYTIAGTTYAAEAVQVVSVNTSTGAITCTASSVPRTITTATPVCVVSGTPGFALKIASATPTAKTSTIVTLGSDIATVAAAGIVAGDWLCLAGDSPVIQLPVEAHSVVAADVACTVLRSMGSERLAVLEKNRDEIIDNYKASFPSRVEQAPAKAISRATLASWVLQ